MFKFILESKEHDLTASRASLNKVITVRGAGENTQYKSLSASQNIPTEQDVLKNNDSEGDDLGKSDEFEKPKKEYKGFVNNYFSVSKNRSPSPLTRSQNIFTDEEDSPYEDR